MVGSGLPAEEYKVHVSIQYLSSCNIFWAIKYRRWPPGSSGGFSAGRWSRRRRSSARSATTTSTLATRCFLLLNRLTSHSLSPGDYPAVPPFPCHAQWVPCPLAGQVQTSHFDLLRCKTSPPNELPVQVDHLPVVPGCHHLGRIVRWRTSSCQLICIAKFCDVLHNKLNWKSGRGCTIGKI